MLAIRTDAVSKRYRLGEWVPYRTLRESIMDFVRRPFGYVVREEREYTWALRDVSIQIGCGEVVGIIGRNGSGKSTLLKILSRITEPTEGAAEIRGRVGSLLEVGTGFHPELTGRENIYLNGAILGMKRAEIKRNFDEIVAFAEIEKFIDTAVKHYSSGMYLRLAFAVAAHLQPEILLVDEVLAVGDAAFQRKCLGKMDDVARQGRTVLFVSHNMGAVHRLCGRAIWLDNGQVRDQGSAARVIERYIAQDIETEGERHWSDERRPGDHTARLCAVRICQPSGVPCAAIDIRKPFDIEIENEFAEDLPEISIGLRILSPDGQIIFHSADSVIQTPLRHPAGRYVSVCQFPAYALNAGRYTLSVTADVPGRSIAYVQDAVLSFSVERTCADLERYGAYVWRGWIGPKLVNWIGRELPAPPGADAR